MSISFLFTPQQDTSESFDFTLTRNQIIELAYKKVGGKSDGQSLSPEQIDDGSKLLNMMIKNWAAEEIYIWNLDWINLPLVASDIANVAGVDYVCIRNNLSSLRNKPGSGDAWKSFWNVLTTTTGTAWAEDTDYHNIANYTLDSNIIDIDVARVKQDTGFTPLTSTTKREYFEMGNPLTTGTPTNFFFRKQLQPEIFLIPAPTNVASFTIELCVYQYPEDFDVGTNNPDFLQEWIEPIVDGLAVLLAPSSGIFGDQLRDLVRSASLSKDNASKANRESGEMFISPNLRFRRMVN